MRINELIKQQREKQGISILQLSKMTGLARFSLYNIEDGKNSPSFNNLRKILKALNIEIKFVINS